MKPSGVVIGVVIGAIIMTVGLMLQERYGRESRSGGRRRDVSFGFRLRFGFGFGFGFGLSKIRHIQKLVLNSRRKNGRQLSGFKGNGKQSGSLQ